MIEKTKSRVNDYFKYDELKYYLDTLNDIKTITFKNININILIDKNKDVNKDIDLNYINIIIKRAYKITKHINKTFNIHLMLSPLKKTFNSTSLKAENCNSGLTYLNRSVDVPSVDIYIVRKEEFGKVIIHEIIHHITLIHSNFKKSNIDKLKQFFNISPLANIDPNETIVEFCATIYHLYQISLETNADFYNLFKDELKYSLYKTQQLLNLQKKMPNGIWYEESHIFCYIIFKTIIMYNFCEFQKIYTFPYNDDVITDFLINHSGFLSSLQKNILNILKKKLKKNRPSNSLCFMVHSDS
jgi:hypothetical protein